MKSRLLLSLLLLTIGVMPSTASAGSFGGSKDKWINLKTSNFNIISNADESQTRKLALKLEQFRYVFSKVFNIKSVSSLPITVVAFKNEGSFTPFKPIYNGKPANVAGYFQRGEDENIIALDVNANSEKPMSVIFHEYTHFLTSRTPREWPLWLLEGIAEVYSSFDVEKNSVNLGVPIRDHVFLLREQFLPLNSLLNVTHDSPIYNEGNKQTIFYAESWALTHYLMFGDKNARQPQLVQFLTLYSSGMDQDKAFAQAFKTDYATMQKDLQKYVQNRTYGIMTVDLKATEVQPDMNVYPLTDAEAQYYLGDLLLQTNRADDAVNYFKQAAALDPKAPRPYEGLGFVSVRHNNFSEAASLFRQAVERGSENYLVHYYYAESLERLALGSGPGILGADVASTVIAELKKAISLGPAFSRSYYMLAEAYLMTGEHFDEGIQAIKTAIRLEPRNKSFPLALAQLEVRRGNYEEARKVLLPLAADSEASIREPASSLIQQIDNYLSDNRKSGSESGPARSQQPADSSGESRRPVLIRRNKPDSQESDDTEAKTNETAPATRTVTRDTAELVNSRRPSLKIDGAQIFEGTLASIECGRGVVLVAEKDGKVSRFLVSVPSKLRFLGHDPAERPNIGCGPIKRAAFIYYKPAPEGSKDLAGEAVTVEFPKP